MNYFFVFLIVFIALLIKSNYYETNMVLNMYHIADKVIHLFVKPFHMIDESDLNSINKLRKLYSISSMMEKRFKMESINVLNIKSARGSHNIPITIYKSMYCSLNKCPVVVYYHGGGFVLGDTKMYEHITTSVADNTNTTVVFIDYRLAPEHKFPSGVNDAIEATKWIYNNADDSNINIDRDKFIIMGDSAGGNFVTVAVSTIPSIISMAIAIYPSLMSGSLTKSSCINADAPILSINTKNWFNLMYFSNRDDVFLSHLSSPLNRRGSDIVKYDIKFKVHVITAEFDILRDEGEAYAVYMKENGADVTSKRYNNTVHGFFGLSICPHGREVLDDVNKIINDHIA